MGDIQQIRLAYERQAIGWQAEKYRSWMPGNIFNSQERERAMLSILRRHNFLPLSDRRILDVGCGPGRLLIRFLSLGAKPENLAGIDVLSDQIELAQSLAPHIDFRLGDATKLPFADATFDLVTAFTSFSSMPNPEMRELVAAEIRRVLRPSGGVLWYDFWVNRGNQYVQALGLRGIRQLFPDCDIDAKRVTLAPPLARRLAPRFWLACCLANAVPFLHTHWLALIKQRP